MPFATAQAQAQAQEASFPPRKPGLWDVVTVTQKPDKVPRISARMCIDAATDKELMDFGLRMSKDTCARYDVASKGATWTIDAECTMGPVKTASRTRITGDFKSKVTVQIDGTMTGMPGSKEPQATQLTQESRWLSADCPGMKPGDVMLENGTKINVKDMRQLRKLLPNIQIR
jgi:hypothetical protein